MLVDGGLTIPGSERIDPVPFMREFLGPALARLQMTFPDLDAYVAWWSAASVDRRLGHRPGGPARLRRARSRRRAAGVALVGVNPDALQPDGGDVLRSGDARELTLPAVLLCAPRGMVNDPNPMQPLRLVQEWAGAGAGRRRALQVPDTNHYTIALGAAGAAAVAAEVRSAVSAGRR